MKKNKSERGLLIMEALKSGKKLTSREVAERISKPLGKEIKIQDVTGVLSRISDSSRCELGHFIEKSKKDNLFVYKMVKEARKLSAEKLYDLTLKTGEYNLSQALKDIPSLRKYVKPDAQTAKPGSRTNTGRSGTSATSGIPGKPGRPPKTAKPGRPPKAAKRGRPPKTAKRGRPPKTAKPGRPPKAAKPGRPPKAAKAPKASSDANPEPTSAESLIQAAEGKGIEKLITRIAEKVAASKSSDLNVRVTVKFEGLD